MDELITKLQRLDLTADEAKVYIELLQKPNTHLQVSYATGVNRTKVYRIVEQLEKRSLISKHTDDRGTFLVAADPATLEVSLVAQEEALKRQRDILPGLIDNLNQIQSMGKSNFAVRTYEGYQGLRQMCWHELKTRGETLAFGNGTIEQLSGSRAWAARHRERQLNTRYKSREIINRNYEHEELPDLASQTLLRSGLFSFRTLPTSIITLDNQIVVYNDTVSIYHWKHSQKIGVEILNAGHAHMMRQIFNYFWALAEDTEHLLASK